MSENIPDLESPEKDFYIYDFNNGQPTDVEEVPPLTKLTYTNVQRNPFDIALIIDGIVYATYNVDGQGAAQFLAQPTFVRFINDEAKIGYVYKDGKFYPPTEEDFSQEG